jgi:hypothetical protein
MTDSITEEKEMVLYKKDNIRLQEKECQIRKFLAEITECEISRFDIGRLLGEIRKEQLFIHLFKSFDEYIQDRFGFKKSYESHMESAWNIRHELEIELEKEPGAFDLPRSIEAAYKLRKAGSKENRTELLKRLKSAGKAPTAEAILAALPKPKEEPCKKKHSFPEFKRLLAKVKTVCVSTSDFGKDRSRLLEEIQSALQELNIFQQKLASQTDEEISK